jgi:thymidylate synthase (FAD)
MQAMFLTRLDREVIARLMQRAAENGVSPPFGEEDFMASQDPAWAELARCRERDECRAKLVRLGMLPE